MKLSKAWIDAVKVTQYYKHDAEIDEKVNNYRMSARVVHDQIKQEAQDLRLQEVYQQSVFSKMKMSPRGIKKGAIELEVSPRGGYRKTLQPEKEDTNKLLN